jgi:tetratricopeptide (TPR) repeat protein
MAKIPAALRNFYKIAIVLVGVVVFFVSYNRFLIDHSLEVLRFSLDQVNQAKTAEDTQELGMLLDYSIMDEVSQKDVNSENLANLEFARTVLPKAKVLRQLEDVQFTLKDMLKEREQTRGVLLTSLDRLVSKTIKGLGYLRYLPGTIKSKFFLRQKADTMLLERAMELEDEWKLEKAKDAYEDFIDRFPRYEGIARAKLRLGYTYRKLGERDSAIDLFEEVLREHYGSKESEMARKFINKENEFGDLIAKREQIIKQIPSLKTTEEIQDAYYRIGTISASVYEFDKAREAFQKVVEIDPKSYLASKAKFNIGWNYKFQSKFEESKQTFNEIIEEDPESELALDSQYQIANTYYKEGKFEEAAKEFEDVAKKAEKKKTQVASLAQFQAGTTYLYDLKNAKEAKKAFDKVREKFQETRFSDYTKQKLDKVGKGHRDYGFKLLKRDRYDEALPEFRTAIEINEYDGVAYSGLSLTHAYLYNQEEALRFALRAAELEPDNEYVYATLGRVYVKLGEYEKAIVAYKNAIAIKPDFFDARYNLAHIYNLREMYDEAIEEYRMVVRLDPRYFAAYGNMGYAYWYKGDLGRAVEQYKKALDINPAYIQGHYNLALIYKQQGNLRDAREEFEEVLYYAKPNSREARKAAENLKEIRREM